MGPRGRWRGGRAGPLGSPPRAAVPSPALPRFLPPLWLVPPQVGEVPAAVGEQLGSRTSRCHLAVDPGLVPACLQSRSQLRDLGCV